MVTEWLENITIVNSYSLKVRGVRLHKKKNGLMGDVLHWSKSFSWQKGIVDVVLLLFCSWVYFLVLWLCLQFGILLPKLFWPSVRKNSIDPENLLKFKAIGREFAKILRSLNNLFKQWMVRTIFCNRMIS